MTEAGTNHEHDRIQQAHDRLMMLGDLTVRFAGVERAVHYPGGPENDLEHSFHLALSAVELAADYYPELDRGLVSQFCTVHDLPEVYAGDTPTFNAPPEVLAQKYEREKAATDRLLAELPPHTADLLRRYEEQVEPEAQFVRFVDKLLPGIIHSVSPESNRDAFMTTYGMSTAEEAGRTRAVRTARLREMFPEFELLHDIRELQSHTWRARMFPES